MPDRNDTATLNSVEVFSHWVGFATPPSESAKLTITRVGEQFARRVALDGTADEVPAKVITGLLVAISGPPVPKFDAALFGLPAPAIRSHYDSCWTDDHPELLARLTFTDGRVLNVRTVAQQAFMLPFTMSDAGHDGQTETFDPRVSRALAEILPNGFLNKDRLAGRSGMLDWAVDELAGAQGMAHDAAAESSDAFGAEASREDNALSMKRRSLDEVRALLAQGANPSAADDVGQTLLMHAAFPPLDAARFRLLVEAGADREARRSDGLTGLHLACAGGMSDAAAEWLTAGANVHARTPEGETPLMLAASWPKIVRLLLDAGADVNAADGRGDTPLTHAVVQQSWIGVERQLEAIRLMIEAGADVARQNEKGETPLTHAKRELVRARVDAEVGLALHPSTDSGTSVTSRAHQIGWSQQRVAEAVLMLIQPACAQTEL